MAPEHLAARYVEAVELHAVDSLRELLSAGLDVRQPVQGKSAAQWLLEMYTRSDRFVEFLRVLLQHGAELGDPLLAPVLLDDVVAIEAVLSVTPAYSTHRTSLPCTFTPLRDVTLLHLAAEFGHLAAARALLAAGADPNARAGVDAFGLGGHSPLFHTVNSNANRSAPVMELLLTAGARPDLRIDGLVWGAGFDWETTLFDLTPISYAQCGCLPQMHRDERQITANVQRLLQAAGRPVPPLANVPNRYLRPSSG